LKLFKPNNIKISESKYSDCEKSDLIKYVYAFLFNILKPEIGSVIFFFKINEVINEKNL
ncbi:unnamed protein product, partial [marine sediment metagenome]